MDMYEVVKYLHDGCDDETFAEIFVRYHYMQEGYAEDRHLSPKDMLIDVDELAKHIRDVLDEIIYSSDIDSSAWWKLNKYRSFADDEDKMYDFYELTKEEFLQSYSYLTEEEYELTKAEVEGRTV